LLFLHLDFLHLDQKFCEVNIFDGQLRYPVLQGFEQVVLELALAFELQERFGLRGREHGKDGVAHQRGGHVAGGRVGEAERDSGTKIGLLFQGNRVLLDLIEGRDDASVGFVAALRHDEVRELGGDVDVGRFERPAGDAAEAAAGRRSDVGWPEARVVE
jgi:hypothetical protein